MIEKRFIVPNAVTAIGVLLGFTSIVTIMAGNYIWAAGIIVMAMVVDGMDGKIARLMNGFSEFGKEFDSFSDSMSFGMAPAVLSYFILLQSDIPDQIVFIVCFFYLLMSVIRLVKFNVMTKELAIKGDFLGIPTPSAAGVLATYLIFVRTAFPNFEMTELYLRIYVFLLIFTSALMVSNIEYKNIYNLFNFRFKNSFFKILAIICGILFVIFFPYTFFPFGIYYLFTGVYGKLHDSRAERKKSKKK